MLFLRFLGCMLSSWGRVRMIGGWHLLKGLHGLEAGRAVLERRIEKGAVREVASVFV